MPKLTIPSLRERRWSFNVCGDLNSGCSVYFSVDNRPPLLVSHGTTDEALDEAEATMAAALEWLRAQMAKRKASAATPTPPHEAETPAAAEPLSEERINRIRGELHERLQAQFDAVEEEAWDIYLARAVERAHGIGDTGGDGVGTSEIDDEVALTRAISVMEDVIGDISDWEDQALADAVRDSMTDLWAMRESIRMRADASYVPQPLEGERKRAEVDALGRGGWCEYVAGIICAYLGGSVDDPRIRPIAGIIDRRMKFLASHRAAPVEAPTLLSLRDPVQLQRRQRSSGVWGAWENCEPADAERIKGLKSWEVRVLYAESARVSVPDDWQLVPKKPTEGMLQASWENADSGFIYTDHEEHIAAAWAEMLAAAPTPVIAAPVEAETPSREALPGYALAMRVLQSDLYHKLDDVERAECDSLVARVPAETPSRGEPVPSEWQLVPKEPDIGQCEACLVEARHQFGHGITIDAAVHLYRAMVRNAPARPATTLDSEAAAPSRAVEPVAWRWAPAFIADGHPGLYAGPGAAP